MGLKIAALISILGLSIMPTALAQLGFPGNMDAAPPSSSSYTAPFKSAFYLYDVQPLCGTQSQTTPDGDCICVCHRYNSTASCISDFYTVDYPFYSQQASCQASSQATGECQCNCRSLDNGQCVSQLDLPPGPPSPSAPGPGSESHLLSSIYHKTGFERSRFRLQSICLCISNSTSAVASASDAWR